MFQYNRMVFFLNLIKEAATKSENIEALKDIFKLKYGDTPAARGLAVQYYEKNFLNKSWSNEYLNKAIDESIEKEPITFIKDFFKIDWARKHLRRAVGKAVENYPIEFVKEFSDKYLSKANLKKEALLIKKLY